jgi:hypothetical protein
MRTIAIALLLAAGCTPTPSAANAPTQCRWAISWSGYASSGTSDISDTVIVDRAQCVYANGVIELKTDRADGSQDDLTLNLQGVAVGHAVELSSYPGSPYYRRVAAGQAIPSVTCTAWLGTAILDAPASVHFNITCREGWDPRQVDTRAPDVHLVGSIALE